MGTKLTTLRDAVQYLAKTVQKAEQHYEKVLVAADHLTRAAEQGYPLFFARAATLQAIPQQGARLHPRSQGSPLGQAEAEVRPVTIYGTSVIVRARSGRAGSSSRPVLVLDHCAGRYARQHRRCG
jgi:hypothetical protein